MVGDNERREVAARLRNVEMHAIPDARIADNPMTVEFIAAAVFYDLPYVRGLFSRLADLIEPSCDRDTPQKVVEEMFGKMRHSMKEEADAYDDMLKSKSVEIHPVDRDTLLALTDEMDAYTECDDERCGKEMPPSTIHDFARRIREALGASGDE